MKTVRIIGAGMGPETVTQEGMRAIREADCLLGAPRMLSAFVHLNKPQTAAYLPEEVVRAVRDGSGEAFAVLVSGDTGFFSAASALVKALDFCKVEVIAGISSLNYFFAKLKRPWQEAALISCHGRRGNLADTVRRNSLTFVLTGKNVPHLAQGLEEAGFEDLRVFVGENLGQEGEGIYTCPVRWLKKRETSPLTVLLIENPAADSRCPTGIPDGEFIRGDVPMTKAEVRSVILGKLALRPEDICGDIGAGTGSVTVEMALSAWKGQVYAVEKSLEGVDLILRNCKKFHVGNVTPVLDFAPMALEDLPPLDAVFIGGSGGEMKAIAAAVLEKNPKARIVASAIALETVTAALEAFQAHDLPCEVIQVGVSRARTTGSLHLLLAQNPIFIISGGGRA